MGNIFNPRLLNTQDETGTARYSATMGLQYGSVAPSNQSVAGLGFQGNSDLFQAQSLMFGIAPIPFRNIQLAFIFPSNNANAEGNLHLFMPDTGELISVSQKANGDDNGCVSFSVNILPSFQIQIIREANSANAMFGNGILCLSTFERRPYWGV